VELADLWKREVHKGMREYFRTKELAPYDSLGSETIKFVRFKRIDDSCSGRENREHVNDIPPSDLLPIVSKRVVNEFEECFALLEEEIETLEED